MKKLEKRILILFLLIATGVTAQIGVGTRTPHPDAMFEVASTNKGILLPRVALTGTTAAGPLSAHVAGMTVYNTATAGTAPYNVTPGYYYNDGSKWIKAADASAAANTTVSNAITSGQLTTTVNGVAATAVTLPVASAASTTATGIIQLAGDLGGTATLPTIASNAINTVKLADNAVTSAKIADAAITPAKLNAMGASSGQVLKWNGTAWAPAADAGLTVTTVSNSIASGQLTTTVNGVAATAVTLPVASAASTTATGIIQLAGDLGGTATLPTIANNAINTAKLVDNAVTSAKIANGAITAAKLDQMTATNGQVLKWNGTAWSPAADAGLTVTTVSNSITSGQLTTTVNGVAATAVTLPVASAASTTATGIIQLAGDLGGTATLPTIASNAINTVKLADNAVTSAKIADAAITPAKLNAMGASSGQVLKWNGTAWAPAADAGLTVTTVSNAITSGQLTTTVNGVAATAVTLPVASAASTTATGIIQLAGDLGGTATLPTIANNAITSEKIFDATIATSDLADNAITTAKIANNSVTIAKLPSGATTTTFLRGDGTWATAASDKDITATEVALATKIDGAQLYAIKGSFTANGLSANVTVAKPTGMTGYYSLTTYKDGKTFRRDISSFDTVAANNNVVTGSGLIAEVYPAGSYNYVLEYFK